MCEPYRGPNFDKWISTNGLQPKSRPETPAREGNIFVLQKEAVPNLGEKDLANLNSPKTTPLMDRPRVI